MTATTTIKVGDKFLYRERYGAKPQETTVVHVTPTGRNLRVAATDKTFKRIGYAGVYESSSAYGRSICRAAPFTEELLAKWTEEHISHVDNQAAKEREEKRQKYEREQRLAAELAEVIAEFNGVLPIVYEQTYANGDRLYVLQLPVKPEYAERKGGYETAMVKCVDCDAAPTYGSEAGKRVRASMAGITGNSGSGFRSTSSARYATDTEALWDSCRQCYHDWW